MIRFSFHPASCVGDGDVGLVECSKVYIYRTRPWKKVSSEISLLATGDNKMLPMWTSNIHSYHTSITIFH